jgi:hypothetical protein
MSEFDRNNKGAIFVSDKKESDTHPDRNGSLNVDGVDYWISGWLKKSKEGKPFLSLSVKRKEERTAPAPKRAPVPDAFDDESLPF